MDLKSPYGYSYLKAWQVLREDLYRSCEWYEEAEKELIYNLLAGDSKDNALKSFFEFIEKEREEALSSSGSLTPQRCFEAFGECQITEDYYD